VIEGATGGARDFQQGDKPFDWDAFKAPIAMQAAQGAWMVNNGYDKTLAEQAVASRPRRSGRFGRLYIANPDLVERFRLGSPLNEPNRATFYGGGAEGYTDYPRYAKAA
jgi:N-ethylmaleimide reductase